MQPIYHEGMDSRPIVRINKLSQVAFTIVYRLIIMPSRTVTIAQVFWSIVD